MPVRGRRRTATGWRSARSRRAPTKPAMPAPCQPPRQQPERREQQQDARPARRSPARACRGGPPPGSASSATGPGVSRITSSATSVTGLPRRPSQVAVRYDVARPPRPASTPASAHCARDPSRVDCCSGMITAVAGSPYAPAIGIGTDVHRLVDGVPMHLAGLAWPDEPQGLEGHSDGDVCRPCRVRRAALRRRASATSAATSAPSEPEWAGRLGRRAAGRDRRAGYAAPGTRSGTSRSRSSATVPGSARAATRRRRPCPRRSAPRSPSRPPPPTASA